MKRFETIEKIPTWVLCYLSNGDPTGLSDDDIVELVRLGSHSELFK